MPSRSVSGPATTAPASASTSRSPRSAARTRTAGNSDAETPPTPAATATAAGQPLLQAQHYSKLRAPLNTTKSQPADPHARTGSPAPQDLASPFPPREGGRGLGRSIRRHHVLHARLCLRRRGHDLRLRVVDHE